VILVIAAGYLETYRLFQKRLERGGVTMSSPELEFGVTGCAQPRKIIVVARIQVDAGECLGMTAVQAFRKPYHR
jgi:hypothetical protein